MRRVSFSIILYLCCRFLIVVTASGISPLIGIGSNEPLITMAQQQQHELLEGISFQIDNVTFSHHLASFNGNLMQNAESLPHPKLMQAIELLSTRTAPALRKELGGDK